MCGGEPKEALPAAMAIELLHNFTLLHDDIMDAAETRRGQESVFKKWDSSTAILSGDAMYAWAFEQLQYYGEDDRYSKKQYARIMQIFLDSARVVCEGQAFDLEFEERTDVTVSEYINMIRGKTAALISASFQLGGAVAGAGEKELKALREIGIEAGIAFQIQDDLLDVTADPTKFGKKRGGDISESKKTYLSILTLELGNDEQTAFLKKVFQNTSVTEQEIEDVITIYENLGILERTESAIQKHYERAMRLISEFEPSEYREELTIFLSRLNNREY